jgi:hypothetical protein
MPPCARVLGPKLLRMPRVQKRYGKQIGCERGNNRNRDDNSQLGSTVQSHFRPSHIRPPSGARAIVAVFGAAMATALILGFAHFDEIQQPIYPVIRRIAVRIAFDCRGNLTSLVCQVPVISMRLHTGLRIIANVSASCELFSREGLHSVEFAGCNQLFLVRKTSGQ